ncbi:MAG: 6-phosphofructokinase [Clostridia bacterium]|nr:6-phosphofructokinase [Clostridia bacterium]
MKYCNAIVGQSGGPTTAINATLSGVIRGCLSSEEIGILYGAVNGVEGMLAGRVVDLTARFEENESELSLLENTPAAALGSCRKKLPDPLSEGAEETYEAIFSFFAQKEIGYFFYIGGNDSMDTVAKLSAYAAAHNKDLVCVGVPKTIDNDLEGTDHTPGYGSAAKYIATSIAEVIRDCAVYTVKAVTIVEIMGRDAGWLTCAAALPRLSGAGEPDLVYLPERDFDDERFLSDVRAALEKHPNVVIAVSEGIRYPNGKYVGEGTQSGVADAFGHRYLAGTGKALETLVREKIGCKARSVELNILQRCAAHSASLCDLEESVEVGRAAVEAAIDGLDGVMMGFVRETDPMGLCITRAFDVDDIANQIKTVPDEFINAEGNGVTDACLSYLAPLIRGEAHGFYDDFGLPKHFVL